MRHVFEMLDLLRNQVHIKTTKVRSEISALQVHELEGGYTEEIKKLEEKLKRLDACSLFIPIIQEQLTSIERLKELPLEEINNKFMELGQIIKNTIEADEEKKSGEQKTAKAAV